MRKYLSKKLDLLAYKIGAFFEILEQFAHTSADYISKETLVLRRNSLIGATICFFITLSGKLPDRIQMFGINFEDDQQDHLGWFIWFILLYLYSHFLANFLVECKRFLMPIWQEKYIKSELINSGINDSVDFADLPPEISDMADYDQRASLASYKGEKIAKRKLGWMNLFILLKLFLEVIVPLCMSPMALYYLLLLIVE